MLAQPISVQLYTVRDALAANLAGTLERIAGLGFTHVELFGFLDHTREYAALLREFNLTAPSAHAALIGQDVEEVFNAAVALGIETVIDPHIDRELWISRESIGAQADLLNDIARQAAPFQLSIGYHNHWWESENQFDGVTGLELFAGMLDPAIVLEVDTYWVEVGGVSATELLQRLGERVRFIHVKDGAKTKVDEDQTAVGSGSLDIPAILAAAPHAMRVVELDGFRGDVFEALQDSIDFLTAHAADSELRQAPEARA